MINHGVRSLYSRIGFFHTGIKSRLVDRCPKSKGHNLILHIKHSSNHVQLLQMLQGSRHGATLVLQGLILRTIVRPAPLSLQLQTCGNQIGSQRFICIIRIITPELIQMISFGLKLFPFQCRQVGTQINVISIIPVGYKIKPIRESFFQFCTHIGTYTQQTERSALTFCIFHQRLNHRTNITSFTYRHHIGQLSVCIETKQQKAIHFRNLRLIQETPAVQVHKRQITITPWTAQRIFLHSFLITQVYRFKCYHIGVSFSFRTNTYI